MFGARGEIIASRVMETSRSAYKYDLEVGKRSGVEYGKSKEASAGVRDDQCVP